MVVNPGLLASPRRVNFCLSHGWRRELLSSIGTTMCIVSIHGNSTLVVVVLMGSCGRLAVWLLMAVAVCSPG